MPRAPGAIRRFFREHPWLTDSLVAGFYLVASALFAIAAAYGAGEGFAPAWLVVGLGVAGTVTLLFRRRVPFIAFAAANVLALISTMVGTSVETLLPLITIYTIGVYRSTGEAWIAFGAGSAFALLGAVPGAMRTLALPAFGEVSRTFLSEWTTTAIGSVLMLLVATLVGTNVGGRKRYVAALVDRAAQLARERDAQAEIASAQERERIAREMHDVIAHSLSVMIALAEGAAASAQSQPERSRDAIGRVAETGRRTLGEVRRLLGTVRAEASAVPAAMAPQPGVDDLGGLVAEFVRAGLPVHLTTTGVPSADAALGLTVYRIVQESLTNSLRHARGATDVTVAMHWRPDAVEIAVVDDGNGAEPGDGGRGLVGIRERAALYGGTATAGPAPGGGWRVDVRLPIPGDPR